MLADAVEVDFRLVEQRELVVVDRAAQVVQHCQAFAAVLVVVVVPQRVSQFIALRGVHRHVGVSQHDRPFSAVFGVHRNADARPHV